MTKKIFIDTDIGSDIDDAFALALAAVLPEVELCGISTVYGPVKVRAQIAAMLMKSYGKNIPIGVGKSQPLSQLKPVWTTGDEEKNIFLPNEPFIPLKDFPDATEILYETLRKNKEEITIVCIAPMSNIAYLIKKYPEVIPWIKNIVFMGGGLEKEQGNIIDAGVAHMEKQYNLPTLKGYRTFYEHNLGSDPEASMIVLSSSISKTMVGKHITREVASYSQKEVLSSFSDTLPQQRLKHYCQIWSKHWKRKPFIFHDPLTLFVASHPSIIKKQYAVKLYVDQVGYVDEYGDMLSTGFCYAYQVEDSSINGVFKLDKEYFRNVFEKSIFGEGKKFQLL